MLVLLVSLAVWLVIEATCLVFFRLARERFSFADASQYVIGPERLAGLARPFDPLLGWTHRYPTPYQERPRARDYGRPLLASYGDSYVHCDEVSDTETWQEELARGLRADVYNFGVGGYGPDQAYLRFRQAREPSTPLVALGFVLENINRVVNRYRPFYYPDTGIPLTKPRFLLRDGALALLPNPIERPEDLARLADAAFLDAIGRDDFWYVGADRPRLRFPYSKLLLDARLWREALSGGRARRGEIDERPARNLWRDSEARGLFLAILDAFAAEASARGSRPLILILPGRPNVEARREGRPIPGFGPITRHCEARGLLCFDGIGALAESAEPVEAAFRPGGHLSAAGNRQLARALLGILCEQGLAATPGARANAPGDPRLGPLQ